MQVVIDIPEEYYNAIKALPYRQCLADTLIIKSGTPLPKGHGRLIDADALTEKAPEIQEYLDVLAPTIIEADKTERNDKE